MIGIGKWNGNVKSMFFSGNVCFEITDENGKYGFKLNMPDGVSNIPDFKIKSINEEGNTLTVQAEVSLLPGKTVDIALNFDNDTMNGTLKVPFIGKIPMNDFKKMQY